MTTRFTPIPYLVNADVPWRIAQFQQEVEDNIQPRPTATIESEATARLGWEETTIDIVTDEVFDTVGAPTSETITKTIRVAVLTPDGTIPGELVPWGDVDQVATLSEYFVPQGESVPEVKIGEAVRLTEVQGARGARLQYTTTIDDEDFRPYFEVDSRDWDSHGDVIAGYQCHVTGTGATPNSQERVYWFLEPHGLAHTANANPDFEGWYSMGVSNRSELTERGKGRAFILDAGNRPGIAFHFYKPYTELQTNTAFTLDDRARPGIFGGTGPHHSARGVGTIHGADYINFRREGAIGARFTTLHDDPETAPAIFMGRSRGTVPLPADVLAGDRLGTVQAGTQTDVSEDYVHIPSAGTDPRNRKHVTTQVTSVATEDFTPGTAQGSRLDFEVTPNGTADLVTGFSIDEPATAGDTSILVRVNRDGTTTQTRVEVGPADSAGTGYRSLRIPN